MEHIYNCLDDINHLQCIVTSNSNHDQILFLQKLRQSKFFQKSKNNNQQNINSPNNNENDNNNDININNNNNNNDENNDVELIVLKTSNFQLSSAHCSAQITSNGTAKCFDRR